ncbi:hypothetical protein ZWY2020_042138 [Hordeum vulgare]|nr:hypothetical protein ZWY2020_042138 [Hordeum vulgare]
MSTLLATRDRNERRRREIREKTGRAASLGPLPGCLPGPSGAGAAAAIASPNFVLSEHAFKRLGLGAGSEDEVEDGYGSDQEGPAVVEGDKDELAISRLGLPAQLIATLEKRGITHLFPIQVLVFEPLNVRF